MSQENLNLVRQEIDAVNRQDLEAWLVLLDEDVECVSRIVSVEGPLRGHDGARRWWQSWFEVFPDYEIQIMELEDLDPVVLMSFRAVGHGAESALPFEDVAFHASHWRDGKCVWWQVFEDKDEALEVIAER
jgi:ketosteroid isomerase-like protein